jgi:predicted SnoaL-like aldol condensation-catalyzing enzyme
MYMHEKGTCSCDIRVMAAYSQQRKMARSGRAAFMAAFREFERSHPEMDAFAALGAVKDILSTDPEAGIIDCGGG